LTRSVPSWPLAPMTTARILQHPVEFQFLKPLEYFVPFVVNFLEFVLRDLRALRGETLFSCRFANLASAQQKFAPAANTYAYSNSARISHIPRLSVSTAWLMLCNHFLRCISNTLWFPCLKLIE
jgi:hypothetical protein